MNTEHLLGDFRLSVNIYSPNILGCQEAKQNFFTVHLLYHPAPGAPDRDPTNTHTKWCLGNGEWAMEN